MNRQPLMIATCISALLGLAACASQASTKSTLPATPIIDPGTGEVIANPEALIGYLSKDQVPDSLALLPPPPAEGSAALAHDQAAAQAAFALRGTPRWEQAISDADLRFPHAASFFTCALGAEISEQETPHAYSLLRRLRADASAATSLAKDHYKRPRPFMANQQDLCTPEGRDGLAGNGSYPSGHTAIGWIWALVLTEIAPDRANPLLARGRNYGESRMVCNVHWNSDLVGGRHMASAVLARLHAEPAFQKDLSAAKTEVAALRAKGKPLPASCATEAAALATPLNVVPF